MRRLAMVLGVLLLLVVGAILVLPRLVSEEMLRARLVSALEGQLERPVSLEGVGFGFRPVPSLHAEGVTLGRTPKQPQEVHVESLDLFLALRPLLKRQVEVKSLSIDGLRADVYLVDEPDPEGESAESTPGGKAGGSVGGSAGDTATGDTATGDTATGDTATGDTATGDTATGGTTTGNAREGYAVNIEAFVLRNGEVRVLRGDEVVLRLTGLEEDLSATLTPAGKLELAGETRVADWELNTPTGRFGREMPGVLQKSLSYDPSQELLQIDEASLKLGDLPIALRGSVEQLSDVPQLNLSFEGGPAELSNIVGLLPSSWIEQAAGIQSSGRVSVQGTVAGPVGPGVEPNFGFTLDLADGKVSGGELPAAIEQIAARLLLSPSEVEIETLTLKSQDSDLDVRGTVSNYREKPKLDLAVDGNLDLAMVTAMQADPNAPRLGGRAVVQGVVRGDLPEVSAKTTGRSDRAGGTSTSTSTSTGSGSGSAMPGSASSLDLLSGLETLATFDLRGVSVDGLEHPIRGLGGKGSLRNQALRVEGLAFRVGESDLQFDGTVDDYRALIPEPGNTVKSKADVTLRSSLLDLDAFQPTANGAASSRGGASGTGASGTGSTGATGDSGAGGESGTSKGAAEATGFELFADLLGRLRGPVRLDIDNARLQRINWNNVQAQGSVTDGVIDVTGLVAKAFSGTVTMRGDIDVRNTERPRFDLSIGASEVAAAEFLTSNPGLAKLSGLGGFFKGKMEFRADAAGALAKDLSLDVRALTSAGDLQVRDGELSGHPAQLALSTYLNQTDLQRLPIRDWLQPFRIRNGRVEFEDLRVQAGDFTLIGNGFTGLDGEMGLRGELQIPEAKVGALRSKLPAAAQKILLGDGAGPVLLPVKVTGPVNKPAVQIDDEKLTARARAQAEAEVQRKKDELKDKARKGIEDKAGDLLNDVLGGKTRKDSTSAAADTTRTVEKEVRGLIKGLFGK